MKASRIGTFLLIASIVLGLNGAPAEAQGEEPPPPPPWTPSYSQHGPVEWASDQVWEGRNPLPFTQEATGAAVGAAAVPLGQPGLSFRYVETFGVTEQAYISDTTHLNYPVGVGTDGINVWIAEMPGRRAIKFASDGAYQGIQIGVAGYDLFQGQTIWRMTDVAVDGGGNIWVADSLANHVLKFDAGGSFVQELGQAWDPGTDNSHFGMPVSVAFDSNGNVYVSDGAETWSGGNHRIQILSSTGSYVNTIGLTGVSDSDNSHFKDPCRIAIDTSDRLYVADSGNHRAQIIDVSDPSSPSYVATLGVSGESGIDESHFYEPSGVGVDASLIYVVDKGNHRI